jgi:hypothetical protein
LAIHLARQWSPTIVAWDPRGSIAKLLGSDESIEIHTPQELTEQLESGEYLEPEPRILVYRSESEDGFEELCNVLFPPYFEGFQGGIAVIVDEAGTLQSAHSINPALNRIIGQSPDTVLVVQTTHMISEWHGKSRSCMNEMFLFRQVGARNFQVVAENCGEDVALECENLSPHHCVHYWFDRREGLQWEVWNDPSLWALDSAMNQRDLPEPEPEAETSDDGHEERRETGTSTLRGEGS